MKRYAFLLLLLASCSKFEHAELDPNPACELCEWADAREGVYVGYMNGNIGSDSVIFEVHHVFMNQSSFEDSTRMYFEVTETWQNNGDVYQWIGSALDSSGVIDAENGYQFTMKADSIHVHHYWYSAGWSLYSMDGTFYR